MNIAQTVFNQVLMMFLMMAVGYFAYKDKLLDEHTTQRISNILIFIVTPFVIVSAYNITFSWQKVNELGIACLLSFVSLGCGLLVGRIALGKKHLIEQFAVVFSNSGFFGIPIVSGVLGPENIFYLSAFMLSSNLIMWTIGVYLVSGDKRMMSLKTFLTSPALIGLVFGAIAFISPIKISGPILQAMDGIGSMNTPLAMLLLGTYIAKSNIFELLRHKLAYITCLLRLVVVPVITIFLFSFVPDTYLTVKLVVLIAACAPCAAMTAMLSQRFGGNYEYAAQIVSLSNILSMVSIPSVLALSTWIW